MWANKNNSNLLNLNAFYRICITQHQHQATKTDHIQFLWWKIPYRYKEWENLPVYDVEGHMPSGDTYIIFTGTLEECRKVADQLVAHLKPLPVLEGERNGP